jgi:hypothetical protein
MEEEFKPIETQEAFDAAIRERLERQKRSVTEEVTKKFDGYLSPEDAAGLRTKITESETTIADLTAKNTAYKQRAAKLKIANETGLPFALAERLTGSTEEEIRADAEALVRYTKPATQAPAFSPETPPKDAMTAAYLDMLRNLK